MCVCEVLSNCGIFICISLIANMWFSGKELPDNAGDMGLIPGLGRSPGEGTGYPLQYSGLENSGQKESDVTERLSHSLSFLLSAFKYVQCSHLY